MPEVHLYDRGDINNPTYQREAEQVNRRGDGSRATILRKLEIENYVHPNAIFRVRNIQIRVTAETDVPYEAARLVHQQAPEAEPWDQLDKVRKDKKVSAAKRWLSNDAAAQMSYEEICEMDTEDEIRGFLIEIADRIAGGANAARAAN